MHLNNNIKSIIMNETFYMLSRWRDGYCMEKFDPSSNPPEFQEYEMVSITYSNSSNPDHLSQDLTDIIYFKDTRFFREANTSENNKFDRELIKKTIKSRIVIPWIKSGRRKNIEIKLSELEKIVESVK